jgi:hypothetical protein
MMRKNKFPSKAYRWMNVAYALLVFLAVTVVVHAADPYWMGHTWPQSKAAYQITEWTVPSSFIDDIGWAADKWSEPSPFYFYRVPEEPPPWEGGIVGFGDPPSWAEAYTEVDYCGNDMCGFVMTFDADLPAGWTDAPCWQVWNPKHRIFAVALHEFGHAVDFESVQDDNTVMYWQYRCYTGLYQRDRQAIDDIY